MQPSQPHEDRELTPKQERLFYSELKDASGVRIPLKGKVRLGGGILGSLVHHYVPDQCPNVFLLEAFITPTELEYIKRYAAANGARFQASYVDAAGGSRAVTTDHRRSLFLPLPTDKSTMARRMADRAAKAVYLDHNTVETPQLVTYIGNGKEGQYFREHHDVADHFERGSDGRIVVYESEASQKTAGFYRLFTVFAYINDVPNGEGATVFPELGIRGEPRAGNALMWPNVRPDGSVEPSTVHEAQTVRAAGVQKLGMNLWVTSLDMSDQQEARKGAIYKLPDMKTPKRFLPWLRRFGLTQEGAVPEAEAETS
jgi:prolyl 4-hydroxylase